MLRIGTRESQLAVWQATFAQNELKKKGIESELVFIKSQGDIDLVEPLYALGVQGVFTKSLDTALLNGHIDIAVHSMKDVPTQLAKGIIQTAVFERASYKDLLVYKKDNSFYLERTSKAIVATSSIRRKAQWLHHFPNHTIENIRGNVNTRLAKVKENKWHGAIFAAAGLDRIELRPGNSIELNWMLPAPAQGAIMVVCREIDEHIRYVFESFNHRPTDICTKIERDFLATLQGGCSAPISALAEIMDNDLVFNGNVCSLDGKEKLQIQKTYPNYQQMNNNSLNELGLVLANELIEKGGDRILKLIRHDGK